MNDPLFFCLWVSFSMIHRDYRVCATDWVEGYDYRKMRLWQMRHNSARVWTGAMFEKVNSLPGSEL